MRDRVFGIETEYAVIYHPGRREAGHPTKLEIFSLFEPAVARRVPGLPRAFSLLRSKPGRFLANGGSFHYEATPQAFEQGLLELASPECRDPFTLLACERAKDELVEEACGEVNARLRALGFRGEVRIGKNNVDHHGNTFGSHESYWVEDPLPALQRGLLLPVWLACWALALPVLAWLVLITAGLAGAGLALAGLPLVALGLGAGARAAARRGRPRAAGRLARAARRVAAVPERLVARLRAEPGALLHRLAWLELPLRPVLSLHSFVHNRFHFRRVRRALTAHLVTRTVFTGAGAVRLSGGGSLFRLAQRPPFLHALARLFTAGERRPVYETRDLFFRPWSAFGARRRLHLMHADANLCEWAQVLRTGTTALVLEAIEAGEPVGPELADPLAALRALSADPSLSRPLSLREGGEASALEIQRRILRGVRRYLARAGLAEELRARGWRDRVLTMWEETLRELERDPEALADRLDWVAKRRDVRRAVPAAEDREALRTRGEALLDAEERALPPEDRRLRELAFRALRADLRYHELGPRGGYRRREARGEVRRLVEPEVVERAGSAPPRDTRAFARGRAIREACERRLSGSASWHRVRLGRRDWRVFPDPLDPAPDGSARGRRSRGPSPV